MLTIGLAFTNCTAVRVTVKKWGLAMLARKRVLCVVPLLPQTRRFWPSLCAAEDGGPQEHSEANTVA